MSCFQVDPKALQTHSETLESIRGSIEEAFTQLGSIAGALGTMSPYEDVCAQLRWMQGKGREEEEKLRRCADVLKQAAQYYGETEQRNLHCVRPETPGSQRPVIQILPGPRWDDQHVPVLSPAPSWQMTAMVKQADRLYGMPVRVPQDE